MIGFIRGKVIYTNDNSIIIDNNGIGYKVECCNLNALEGDEIEVFISTYMRENELKLFGFKQPLDLKIFELLLSVNGVGPKAAIQLVGGLGSRKIINAISINKPDLLKIKGIGQKTAQKIILDLNNKIKDYQLLLKENQSQIEFSDTMEYDYKYEDAKEALINLGFKEREIDEILNKISDQIENDFTTEQIIKILLKNLRK